MKTYKINGKEYPERLLNKITKIIKDIAKIILQGKIKNKEEDALKLADKYIDKNYAFIKTEYKELSRDEFNVIISFLQNRLIEKAKKEIFSSSVEKKGDFKLFLN